MLPDFKLLAFSCFFVLVRCDYNEVLAKKLLYLSSAAYSNSTNQGICMGSIFNSNGSNYRILDSFEEVCDDAGSLCSGYIVEASVEKNLYYVFSGSHGRTQLPMIGFANLKPDKDFLGMGQVMSYFVTAHNILWNRIKPTLVDPKYKSYKAIFTGHSLGGALATLAAAQCGIIGFCPPDYVELYTFGEPRTGTVKFAKALDTLIGENFRIVHRNDIIPTLPPCAKTGGLLSLFFDTCCSDIIPTNPYHHGTEIWYNNNMMWNAPYVTCTESNAVQNCPFQMQYTNVFFPDFDAPIEDHKHYFDLVVTEYGKTGCTDKSKMFY